MAAAKIGHAKASPIRAQMKKNMLNSLSSDPKSKSVITPHPKKGAPSFSPYGKTGKYGDIPVLARHVEPKHDEPQLEVGYEMLKQCSIRSQRSVQSTVDSGFEESSPVGPGQPEVVCSIRRKGAKRSRPKKRQKSRNYRKKAIMTVMVIASFLVGLFFGMGLHAYLGCPHE